MKPTMEELQSRNDTQAVTITETQASKPTHRERLLAEAEAIFRGQE